MSNVPKLRFRGYDESWKTHKINELAETVTSGSRDWAKFYSDRGDKFIRMTNLQRDSIRLNLSDLKFVDLGTSRSEGTRTSLQAGDILCSITAELGKIGWVDELLGTAYINQHTALIRLLSGKSNSKFVAMLLQTERMNKRINRLNDSGAKAGLNLPTIRSIPVILPTIAEQQKIAAFLTAVDTKIEQLTQKEALLKQYKKGVMQKIFSQEIRFKADDGSEFPEWKLTSFSEIMCIPEKEKLLPVDRSKIITVKLHLKGVVRNENTENLSLGSTYYKRKAGQFLYGKQNLFNGAFGLIPAELNDFATSGDIPALEFFPNCHPDFVVTFLSRESFYKKLEGIASGTGSKRIHEHTFLSINAELPSKSEQKKIADFIVTIDEKVNLATQEISQMKAFKKGLLQQMFV